METGLVDRTMATVANFVACGRIQWRMMAYGGMGGRVLGVLLLCFEDMNNRKIMFEILICFDF